MIPETSRGGRAYWDQDGTAYIEKATEYAEVGKFQIFLLIVCLIAYANISTVPNILNKFSTSIQCDYQLIKEDKKAVNDVVYVCMILGGASWSLLADTLSRKWTLAFVLLIHSVSTIGLTLSTTFLMFGFFRVICAFTLTGIVCITVTFIAEFQICYFRGSMICCLQLAEVIGMVAIPALPFSRKSLMMLSSVPPIFALIGLMFFPDSPRFLLSRGREKQAIRSLQMIHAINTGVRKTNFPICHLKDNITVEEIRRNSVVKAYIPAHLEPKFVCVPVIMLTQFVLLFSYYTLVMWFPYMVARADAFFPLTRMEDIPQDCKVGLYHKREEAVVPNSMVSGVKFIKMRVEPENDTLRVISITPDSELAENPCSTNNRRHFDKRISTMVALACMPSIIWVVVKIDTLGRKFFITLAHVVAGCLAFASYYMHNVGKELLFSCLFDSVTLLSVTVSQCLAVELFPTRVRVLGVALVAGSGQLGAVLADIGGAISFGLSCVVVVALIAVTLATSGILIMILPNTTGIALR